MNSSTLHAAASVRASVLRGRPAHSQRGVVVFIALIALVVLSLAAAALLRSTDTAGVIAGNMAFKEAATGAADTGAERAFVALPELAKADVDKPNQYYRLKLPSDANGVPTSINWNNVPCYDKEASNTVVVVCDGDKSTYRVQYVIDRLCDTAPLKTDPQTLLMTKCVAGQPFSSGGGAGNDLNSHAQNTNIFGSLTPPPGIRPTIHYRVTVRVLGPRNTFSIVQTTVELPFS